MVAKYRVIIRVGYQEAFFDFDVAADAAGLARTLLEHSVASEDTKKQTSIIMCVTDVNAEDEE